MQAEVNNGTSGSELPALHHAVLQSPTSGGTNGRPTNVPGPPRPSDYLLLASLSLGYLPLFISPLFFTKSDSGWRELRAQGRTASPTGVAPRAPPRRAGSGLPRRCGSIRRASEDSSVFFSFFFLFLLFLNAIVSYKKIC